MGQREWRVCPVTIRVLAMLADHTVAGIVRHRRDWTPTRSSHHGLTVEQSHPDATSLWRGIRRIDLHAWAHGRFVADVVFDDARGTRFCDGQLELPDLPAAVASRLPGMAMTVVLDHPLLHGLVFQNVADVDGRPLSPPSAVPLGPPCDTPLETALETLAETRRLMMERRP